MPDNPQAASDMPPLKRIQEQVGRLAHRPSGLVDLGHALLSPSAPSDERACEACRVALPEYIEAEMNGEPVRRLFPGVARHLELCATCVEAYVDLLELTLATEQEPLPIPAAMPALDLGFLPPLSTGAMLAQFVERLATKAAQSVARQVLVDLPAAARAFFARIRERGEGFRFQPAHAPAMGFGRDLPPALQAILGSYTATCQVLEAFSPEELEAELGRDRSLGKLQKQVRTSFREAGMDHKQADRWAREYVVQAQAHAIEFVALARELSEGG